MSNGGSKKRKIIRIWRWRWWLHQIRSSCEGLITRGLYSYLIFTQKLLNCAKTGVLRGTPKKFPEGKSRRFYCLQDPINQNQLKNQFNFVWFSHKKALRKQKKVTRNSHFSRPSETDPYANLDSQAKFWWLALRTTHATNKKREQRTLREYSYSLADCTHVLVPNGHLKVLLIDWHHSHHCH